MNPRAVSAEHFIWFYESLSFAAMPQPRRRLFIRLQDTFNQEFPDATPEERHRARAALERFTGCEGLEVVNT